MTIAALQKAIRILIPFYDEKIAFEDARRRFTTEKNKGNAADELARFIETACSHDPKDSADKIREREFYGKMIRQPAFEPVYARAKYLYLRDDDAQGRKEGFRILSAAALYDVGFSDNAWQEIVDTIIRRIISGTYASDDHYHYSILQNRVQPSGERKDVDRIYSITTRQFERHLRDLYVPVTGDDEEAKKKREILHPVQDRVITFLEEIECRKLVDAHRKATNGGIPNQGLLRGINFRDEAKRKARERLTAAMQAAATSATPVGSRPPAEPARFPLAEPQARP